MDQTNERELGKSTPKCIPDFINSLNEIGLLLERVEEFVHSTTNKAERNKVLLCMSQIQKVLPLLVNAHSKADAQHFERTEISRYLTKRIHWCLEESKRVLNGLHQSEVEGCFGQFVHRIDMALQIMSGRSSIDISKPENWKPVIDDLLCQALTIAGMSGGIDSEEITASCHKVLRECGRLESECITPGASVHCELVADWLLQLERRVNTALLRLVLKVYSDPKQPLKRLVKAINTNKSTKSPSDLDSLVDDLDFYNDCIQHIALFALACSEDSKCVLKIRCCLASLESLEDNLVPAIVALYLDRTHAGKRELLKFFVSHWLQEVESMQTYLDKIIDPIAFSAITLESIEQVFDLVKTKTLVNEVDVESVWTLIAQAAKLGRHLEQSNFDTEMKMRLNSMVHECRCTLKIWFGNRKDKSNRPMTINRILKRLELLVSTVRKISAKLSEDLAMKNSSYQDTSSLLAGVSFPESIRGIAIDISSNASLESRKIGQGDVLQKLCFANFHKLQSNKMESNEIDRAVLEPYVSQVAEKTKTMFINTLYAPSPRRKPRGTPRIVLGNKENSKQAASMNCSLALDITDILENLGNETDTLSTVDYTHSSGGRGSLEPVGYSIPNMSGITLLNDSNCGSSKDFKTYIEQTDLSSIITIDRLNDLKEIEERIDYLKNRDY